MKKERNALDKKGKTVNVRKSEWEKGKIETFKKKIKQEESVGVRDGGSKSGEKEGRESGMAAHQS